MTTEWIDISDSTIVRRGEPDLIETHAVRALRSLFHRQKGTVVEIDLSGVESSISVVHALQEVLPFPDWCGSSWDSIDDAFVELTEMWKFPLLVLVRGLPELLATHTHVGLNAVLMFSALTASFGRAERQVQFVYLADGWAGDSVERTAPI